MPSSSAFCFSADHGRPQLFLLGVLGSDDEGRVAGEAERHGHRTRGTEQEVADVGIRRPARQRSAMAQDRLLIVEVQ